MSFSRTFRRYRGWLALGAIALAAIIVFAVVRQAKPDEQKTSYSTSAASKGTLSVTVSGTGNLEVGDQTEVWPQSSGTVANIEVAEGDAVKKGDVLFTLDASDAEAATAKALAGYRQAQSGVAQAQVALTRAESSLSALKERADAPTSTVSDDEIDAAEAEVTSAKASLAASKASRTTALNDYNDALSAEGDLDVTAPVSGIVWTLDIAEGDSVSTSGSSGNGSSSSAAAASSSTSGNTGTTSAPLVIVPKRPLVVTLAVNEVDMASIKVGQRADLEFDALPDLTLTGKVAEVSDEGTVDQGVVTFDVTLSLDVANKQLKPGMSVSATIVTAIARNALLVPNAAVKSDDQGSYVQVMKSATSQPQRVTVETGMSSATQTEILSGLSEGDAVVTATSDSSSSSGNQSQRQGGGLMMMGGGPGR